MSKKLKSAIKNYRFSIRMKMILGLSSIGVILLVSSIITVLQYSRMSSYVSDLIAENIRSINIAQRLSIVTDNYNLQALTLIGDSTVNNLPYFDRAEFVSNCDSLRKVLTSSGSEDLVDSVLVSCDSYINTSFEIDSVILSNFINSRDWYFDKLQPIYNKLNSNLESLSLVMIDELKKNSATFDRGFYRSIIPGAVAVGAGLLLVLLFLFYTIVYYVNPLYKMLAGLKDFVENRRKYSVNFDGNDQLKELNDNIIEITEDNLQLRKRNKGLREALSQKDV